jgi:hypothetical protein
MAKFNYLQIVYGGMVAVAGVNEVVDTLEIKNINKVFDTYIKIPNRDKKEVLKIWKEMKEEKFVELIIEELKLFPKMDQLEAYKYVVQFINFSNHQYLKSKKSQPKGVDPERAEMSQYWDKANVIREGLGISMVEYNAFIGRR